MNKKLFSLPNEMYKNYLSVNKLKKNHLMNWDAKNKMTKINKIREKIIWTKW